MKKPAYIQEIVLTLTTLVWFLFVSTNVNQTLGFTYQAFTIASLIIFLLDSTIYNRNIQITLHKGTNGLFNAILGGFGGWIALIATSVVVLKFIAPTQATLSSVLSLMASAPALANSKVANFLTFGFAVAFIETNLWARGLEFICGLFHITINKSAFKKISYIIILAVLSLAFMLFHVTAKGIENTASLVIVFIMMFISLSMITLTEETRGAIFMHIFANAISSYLALFATGALQLG